MLPFFLAIFATSGGASGLIDFKITLPKERRLYVLGCTLYLSNRRAKPGCKE